MLPCPCQSSPEAKHIINVEIDGPRHPNARTRGFTQRQDDRLARGARVVRWDLMSREQQKKGTMRSCRTFEI
jgi:hypothetical protein